MKKVTIIGFVLVLLVIAGLLFWHHKQHSSVAPIMEQRIYTITPDTFFASLQHLIAPKDGESHQQLLLRYFKQHGIDIDTKPAALFADEVHSRLFVRVTKSDQNKVEQLVMEIISSK